MEIKNLTIYGGNQQFADSIINQYSNTRFGQNDIELLKLIAESKSEESTKYTLAQAIAVVNNETSTLEEQKTASSRISQFLLDHKEDITAWAGRVSKIAIGAILAKYGLSMADVGL
jgi:hypothetical protein